MRATVHETQAERTKNGERILVKTNVVAAERLSHPRTVAALRVVTALVSTYVALSVLTVGAIVVMRNNTAEVTDAVWTRAIIVVGTALLMLSFAARAARGSRRSYRRLRILPIVMVVAIVVIVAIPGAFPLWLKIEQVVCAVLLTVVAVIVNGRAMRCAFAA